MQKDKTSLFNKDVFHIGYTNSNQPYCVCVKHRKSFSRKLLFRVWCGLPTPCQGRLWESTLEVKGKGPSLSVLTLWVKCDAAAQVCKVFTCMSSYVCMCVSRNIYLYIGNTLKLIQLDPVESSEFGGRKRVIFRIAASLDPSKSCLCLLFVWTQISMP